MTDIDYQLAYACWHWDMWVTGYGSYEDIEQAVRQGRLIPLVKPEHQAAALAKRRPRSWWRRLLRWVFRLGS